MTFTIPTDPDAITDDNWYPLVNKLMKAQFRYTAWELTDNAERWGEDFISDDGTDYLTTALDAAYDLMSLRYEGDLNDLKHWLHGTPEYANMGSPVGGNPPRTVRDIDSAGGLCPELVDFIHRIDPC